MGYAADIICRASFIDDVTVFALFLAVHLSLQRRPSILNRGIEQVFTNGIPVLAFDR